MKVLLVVLAVAGVSAVCIYSMALSGSQAGHEDSTQAPATSPTAGSAGKAQLLDTGTGEQPPPESPPPAKHVDAEKPPAEMPPPQETKSQPAGEGNFDPLLGEKFDEGAIRGGAPRMDDLGSRGVMAMGSTPEEAVKNRDMLRIDKQGQKMEKGLNRKLNTIASKMKLDARTREDLLAISRDGLSEVVDIRKQFVGREMTEAERAYMKDQIKAVNSNTTENIRRLLGDDGFKQFKQEGRYYDNPNARVLDKMKNIERQNRNMQKKIDQQNRRKTSRKPRSIKPR